jgi:N-methylhydantoinase B/oxoprolinase/acetone carboxylase alpha subunit
VLAYRRRRGSGGSGRRRGGDGLVRALQFLAPATTTVIGERRRRAPYGLAGGAAGRAGRDTIVRRGGRVERIKAKGAWTLQPGERIRIETPGGGGHGRR